MCVPFLSISDLLPQRQRATVGLACKQSRFSTSTLDLGRTSTTKMSTGNREAKTLPARRGDNTFDLCHAPPKARTFTTPRTFTIQVQ